MKISKQLQEERRKALMKHWMRGDTVPYDIVSNSEAFDRDYRSLPPFMWTREVTVNSLEAGASRIKFGIFWTYAQFYGTFLRTIEDNGCGMPPEQLGTYMKTIGESPKINPSILNKMSEDEREYFLLHANQGRGGRYSLASWNSFGISILSVHNKVKSMARLNRCPKTMRYGIVEEPDVVLWDGTVGRASVYPPFINEEGFNWESAIPPWIEDHGTVVILHGSHPAQHTVLNDISPYRNDQENQTFGLIKALNDRFYEFPVHPDTGKPVRVTVEVLMSKNVDNWPPKKPTTDSNVYTHRPVYGAKHYINTKADRKRRKKRS